MRFLLVLAATVLFGANTAQACPGHPNCTNTACAASAAEKDTKKAEATGQEVVIKVSGMTCDGCANKITTALEASTGVNSARRHRLCTRTKCLPPLAQSSFTPLLAFNLLTLIAPLSFALS